jgi:FixJ family two-component response regulator
MLAFGPIANCPLGQLDHRLLWQHDARMSESAIRIAVVDDDASVRKALARLLSISPFVPATFGSAQDFLDSLPVSIPDCLVLDLQMPDMTGLDLQEQLGRIGIQIPTIIVTAHDEANLRQRCRLAGAAAYLIKPLEEATLLASINLAIGRSPNPA